MNFPLAYYEGLQQARKREYKSVDWKISGKVKTYQILKSFPSGYDMLTKMSNREVEELLIIDDVYTAMENFKQSQRRR